MNFIQKVFNVIDKSKFDELTEKLGIKEKNIEELQIELERQKMSAKAKYEDLAKKLESTTSTLKAKLEEISKKPIKVNADYEAQVKCLTDENDGLKNQVVLLTAENKKLKKELKAAKKIVKTEKEKQ